MRDPEPFRWDAQTKPVQVAIVVVGVVISLVALALIVVIGGLMARLVFWAWS